MIIAGVSYNVNYVKYFRFTPFCQRFEQHYGRTSHFKNQRNSSAFINHCSVTF